MSRTSVAYALEFQKPIKDILGFSSLSLPAPLSGAGRQASSRTRIMDSTPRDVEKTQAQGLGTLTRTGQDATGSGMPATADAVAGPADVDRALVRSALAGDQSAFAELVGRYQGAVFNMAQRMLGDTAEAEDAAQEVFVRAWNQLHTFQLDRRFSTWLLSISSHHCIDLLRRRRPTAPLDDVALYKESEEPQPDEVALAGEQREMVQKLLNRLPDKYRSVTVLRYYNDLSYEEIARITGLTESAVKTQLHRARRMLAEQLLTKGGAPDGMQHNL